MPSTILARMFSGFFCCATCSMQTCRSRSTTSPGKSSIRRASGFAEATCMASSLASSLNSGVRATKSVSQLSSTSAPIEPSWCTYDPMSPCVASRPARFSALTAPLLRSASAALSRSPPVSSSAFLQSIMPAPVRARSSATNFAGISFTVAISSLLAKTPPSRRGAREGGGQCCHQERIGRLAFTPAARFRWGRPLLRLEPRRDRLRLGPPLAPRRLLLLIAFRLRLDARLGRVGHALALFGRIVQRHLAARFADHVRDRRGDQRDRPDRVVVAGNRHVDQVGIGVRVHDRDHRNPQLVRLGDGDPLLLRVHHEQRAGQAAHVLDAGEILLQLHPLPVEQQLLFLGVVLELAFRGALLQLLQPLDLLLDRLEVRERPAQPPLRHIERPAALRFRLEDVLELLLGADEQHPVALQHHAAQQVLRRLDLPQRLLEIDDVDAGALGEDEPAHLGIPAARLMTEMDTRFQQVLQLRLRHALPLVGSFRRCSHFRCHPGLRGPNTESSSVSDYRLLNWNRLRAPARPGFLRSTTRGSRVSRPCSRSFLRCCSSARHSARAIASRRAPACPVTPPPRHSARTSKAPSVSVAVNGCWMCDTSDGRGK